VPGIYVDRIVRAEEPKQVELLTIANDVVADGQDLEFSPAEKLRRRIAARAAREIQDGYYINLGVGIPTVSYQLERVVPPKSLTPFAFHQLVTEYLPSGVNVWLESENGILGMGPFPAKDSVDP
jgi:3-oxoacid CoA-transferase